MALPVPIQPSRRSQRSQALRNPAGEDSHLNARKYKDEKPALQTCGPLVKPIADRAMGLPPHPEQVVFRPAATRGVGDSLRRAPGTSAREHRRERDLGMLIEPWAGHRRANSLRRDHSGSVFLRRICGCLNPVESGAGFCFGGRTRCESVESMELFAQEKKVLGDLKAKGYEPAVIYDVGASNGVWSDCIYSVLPNAEYHLFEPLSEFVDFYKADLQSRMQRLPNLHLHPIALGDVNETAEMFVAVDGFGSSLHDRGEIPEVKARVSVPKYRLDSYVAERRLPPPDVMKIDSQGYEDAILRGSGDLLKAVKVLLLETWLQRGYGPSTPLLWETMELLRAQGFSLVRFGECFFDDKHRLYSVDAFFFAESLLQEFWLSPEI